MQDLVELGLEVGLLKVHREGNWDHAVDVQLFGLTVRLDVVEELVLGRQRLVPFYVVDQLFVAELAQSLKVDARAEGLPLKVEQVRRVRLLPGGEVLGHPLIWLRDLREGGGPFIARGVRC